MPPGRAPVQRQLFCRSPWWRWAGCGSTRGACGTARFPHGGRVGHGCAGSAIAREADGRQDVGGGRRGGGDERAGGAQGDEAEVLSTLLAERYERRSVMVTSNLVFSPWDRNVRAPPPLREPSHRNRPKMPLAPLPTPEPAQSTPRTASPPLAGQQPAAS